MLSYRSEANNFKEARKSSPTVTKYHNYCTSCIKLTFVCCLVIRKKNLIAYQKLHLIVCKYNTLLSTSSLSSIFVSQNMMVYVNVLHLKCYEYL